MIVLPATRLLDVPMVGVYPIDPDYANVLLVKWKHKLGPVNRPFRQEAFALEMDGEPIAVAVSGSIVNGPVAGYEHDEVVELTRLASSVSWANRIMLRVWREVCAPRWKCWPVKAAVSYSHNALHAGSLYRLDGWEAVKTDAGGRTAMLNRGQRRYTGEDPRAGKKTLWVWRYGN